MARLDSMIYLSPGNLPSQWAHTGQIAKMSQAFAQKVPNFELVTSGDIYSIGRGIDNRFQEWYGLNHLFKLVRIPAHVRSPNVLPKDYADTRYHKWASAYAYLKSPSLIYTRTPEIANLLLGYGASILWEWHEFVNSDQHYIHNLMKHPNLLGVVALSPYLAENFAHHGLPSNKLFVAPSAVDLENFLPYQSKEEARHHLGFDKDANLVVYSGHLYDYKGIPTLLELALLMPNCQFILVGGWPEDCARVQGIVDSQGLINVQVVGHVPQAEVSRYLYAADILLLPTSQSWNLAKVTSPLKLFEYMAVKRPIVSSALPTIMTVLHDGRNSVLAEPDNPLSFKQAITTLFEDSVLAEAVAEQAFQDVQQWTWDNRADQILQFAIERLERHSPASISPLRKWVRGAKLLLR